MSLKKNTPVDNSEITQEDIMSEYNEMVIDVKKIQYAIKRIINKVSKETDNFKKEKIMEALTDMRSGISQDLDVVTYYEEDINDMIDRNIFRE